MSTNNPEVENHLQALTRICFDALEGERTGIDERAEPILKSLLMSGYARTADTTLQAELESRVKKQHPRQSIHRGSELIGITKQLQDKLNKLKLWESKQPETFVPAKAANISSATDA